MENLISISPSMLFISNNDWQDVNKKDLFLRKAIEILKEISEYKTHKIIWTERLEEILWTSPQYNPWLHIHDVKNTLVTILYRYLSSNTEFLDCTTPLKEIQPQLKLSIDCNSVLNEYSNCYNKLINENIVFLFYNNCINFTYENINLTGTNNKTFSPLILRDITDFLKTINYSTLFWPNSVEEINKLNTSITICKKILFNERNFQYNYSFSKSFTKKIIGLTVVMRNNLIQKLTKRLCLSNIEAAQDAQLQNEWIDSIKEYRFRITPRPTSTRVHYKFHDNEIVFLEYFGVGEHDDGL